MQSIHLKLFDAIQSLVRQDLAGHVVRPSVRPTKGSRVGEPGDKPRVGEPGDKLRKQAAKGQLTIRNPTKQHGV